MSDIFKDDILKDESPTGPATFLEISIKIVTIILIFVNIIASIALGMYIHPALSILGFIYTFVVAIYSFAIAKTLELVVEIRNETKKD